MRQLQQTVVLLKAVSRLWFNKWWLEIHEIASTGEVYSKYRTPSGLYYCKTCNVSLNSESQFRQHLGSKKHMKNANQSNENWFTHQFILFILLLIKEIHSIIVTNLPYFFIVRDSSRVKMHLEAFQKDEYF